MGKDLDWESEFDENLWVKYEGSFEDQRYAIKAFIKSLLSKSRQDLIKELEEKIKEEERIADIYDEEHIRFTRIFELLQELRESH